MKRSYIVNIRVVAGFLVKIEAESPEQAALQAVATSRRGKYAGFYVNKKQESLHAVWDEEGNVLLQIGPEEEENSKDE